MKDSETMGNRIPSEELVTKPPSPKTEQERQDMIEDCWEETLPLPHCRWA